MLNSRELFNDFKEQYNTRGMTDIQKAARFFMLLKTSYGSGRTSYGCVKKNIRVMSEYLQRIQTRLEDVVVENRDFENLIKIYDRKDAVIYMDPPYYGTERYYQVQFSQQDHERLRKVAGNIKGRFLISYNDCKYIRDLYRDFNIYEVCRNNSLMNRYGGKENTYKELVITNF